MSFISYWLVGSSTYYVLIPTFISNNYELSRMFTNRASIRCYSSLIRTDSRSIKAILLVAEQIDPVERPAAQHDLADQKTFIDRPEAARVFG